MKILVIIIMCCLLSGCAGLGLNKKATLMPDEFWVGGETNPNEEDSGKWTFGFKWKFNNPKQKGE